METVEAALGPDPEIAGAVDEQGSDVGVAQAVALVGTVAEDLEALGRRIEQREPVLGGDPEQAEGVLGDVPDPVVTEARRVVRIVAIGLEDTAVAVGGALETTHSGREGAHPESSVCVLEDRLDAAVRQPARLLRSAGMVRNRLGARIETIQTSAPGRDPERARAVFEQRADVVGGEGRRVEGIVEESGKAIAVEAGQALFGAEP